MDKVGKVLAAAAEANRKGKPSVTAKELRAAKELGVAHAKTRFQPWYYDPDTGELWGTIVVAEVEYEGIIRNAEGLDFDANTALDVTLIGINEEEGQKLLAVCSKPKKEEEKVA